MLSIRLIWKILFWEHIWVVSCRILILRGQTKEQKHLHLMESSLRDWAHKYKHVYIVESVDCKVVIFVHYCSTDVMVVIGGKGIVHLIWPYIQEHIPSVSCHLEQPQTSSQRQMAFIAPQETLVLSCVFWGQRVYCGHSNSSTPLSLSVQSSQTQRRSWKLSARLSLCCRPHTVKLWSTSWLT